MKLRPKKTLTSMVWSPMLRLMAFVAIGIALWMTFIMAAAYTPIIFPIATAIVTWILLKRAGKDPVAEAKQLVSQISARAEAAKPEITARRIEKKKVAAKAEQKRLERK